MLKKLHNDDEADDRSQSNPMGVGETLDEEAQTHGAEDNRKYDGHGSWVSETALDSGARSVRTQPADLRRPVSSKANFQST